MARGNDPNSGGSSFFICLGDAPHLDTQACGKHTVAAAAAILLCMGCCMSCLPAASGRLVYSQTINGVNVARYTLASLPNNAMGVLVTPETNIHR